jgi:hypothetical protein
MKKLFFVALVLACFGLTLECWADFYVISTGRTAKRTMLVSPKTTPTESGTALLNAINGITDASASNPYLLIIEPGIYHIGTSSFQMKSYVDVEGSGQTVTTIRGNIDSSSAGVVLGANNAELRNLTVENTGGGNDCIAIYNSGASPQITDVTAKAGASSVLSSGIVNNAASPTITMVSVEATSSVYNRAVSNGAASSPSMNYVTIQASGAGTNMAIHNTGSNTGPQMRNVIATVTGGATAIACHSSASAAPTMTDSTFTASGATNFNWGIQAESSATLSLTNVTSRGFNGGSGIGLYIYNTGGSAEIRHSLLSGVNNSIKNDSSSNTVQLGTTQLKGTAAGTLTCVHCYGNSFTALNSSCATP